eukprot:UN21115
MEVKQAAAATTPFKQFHSKVIPLFSLRCLLSLKLKKYYNNT